MWHVKVSQKCSNILVFQAKKKTGSLYLVCSIQKLLIGLCCIIPSIDNPKWVPQTYDLAIELKLNFQQVTIGHVPQYVT